MPSTGWYAVGTSKRLQVASMEAGAENTVLGPNAVYSLSFANDLDDDTW